MRDFPAYITNHPMRLPALKFKTTFSSKSENRPSEEKKSEWWKIAVIGLMVTAPGLLLASCALAGSSSKPEKVEESHSTTFQEINTSGEDLIHAHQRLLPMAQVYCLIQSCIVTCSFIPASANAGSIAAILINSDYQNQCPDKMMIEELIFENCRFSGDALELGWLPTELQVNKLTLKRCALTSINADAFSTVPFKALTSLRIIGNAVTVLQKSSFDQLVSLQELVISDNLLQTAETDLLAGTASSLQIIQISGSIRSEIVLKNILGQSPLPRVQILSLSDNSLGTISGDTLKGVPNVQSVYLTNSGILTIEATAFEPFAKSVRQIFLANNKMTSLPNGLFDSIIGSNPRLKLTLANNDWICNCELEWLREISSTHPEIIVDRPSCASPAQNFGLGFLEANFCGVQTTTVSGSSSEIVEPTTSEDEITASDRSLVTLTCKGLEDREEFRNSKSYGRKLLATREFNFFTRPREFSAHEEENGSIYVNLGTSLSTYTLIWFYNDFDETNSEPSGISCIANVRKSIYLSELRAGVSYTICLLEMSGDVTSPFDCLSLQTRLNFGNGVWIAIEDRTLIISCLTALLIVVCIISMLGSYLVVRRNPRLLKGNKRIIMVRHRATDAIVLPERIRLGPNKNSPPKPTEVESSSHGSGYITPVGKEKLLVPRGSVTSGSSSRSSATSYVSGIEPTSMQLMTWRIGRIKEILSCSDPNDFDDSPPPLPPPRNQSIPSLSLNVHERHASNDTSNPTTSFFGSSADTGNRSENNSTIND